jgi:hypothetical protein
MTKFLEKIFIPLFYTSIFCVLGFGIYFFYINYQDLTIDPLVSFQIDPFNVISSFLTLFFGIYIVRTLGKRDAEEKIRKDYLIKYFLTFQEEFTDAIRISVKKGTKLDHVTGIIKRYRNRAHELVELAKEESLLKTDSIPTDSFLKEIQVLNKLLTSTPKSGEVEDGIRIDDGKLEFSSAQLDKISRSVFKIQRDIYKISVEISKS